MRERPSLPADVAVSGLLYMLAIRAPRRGGREGREEGGRMEGSKELRGGDKLRMTKVEKSEEAAQAEGERRRRGE